MQNVEISNNKRAQEPVSEMDSIVVIKVVRHILPCDFAVVIIGVVTLRHFLVQPLVKVPKHLSSILWPVMKENKNQAEVYHREHADNPPESLTRVEEVKVVGLEISHTA